MFQKFVFGNKCFQHFLFGNKGLKGWSVPSRLYLYIYRNFYLENKLFKKCYLVINVLGNQSQSVYNICYYNLDKRLLRWSLPNRSRSPAAPPPPKPPSWTPTWWCRCSLFLLTVSVSLFIAQLSNNIYNLKQASSWAKSLKLFAETP